jgi:hypothetical protein
MVGLWAKGLGVEPQRLAGRVNGVKRLKVKKQTSTFTSAGLRVLAEIRQLIDSACDESIESQPRGLLDPPASLLSWLVLRSSGDISCSRM